MQFAFSKKTSFFDRLIKWWDRSQYCHVECILSQEQDGTYTIASSQPGVGVRVLTGQTLLGSEWDIVTVPSVSVLKVKEWFDLHDGESYYWLGLFGFLLRPFVGGSKSKWFCSEACMAAAFGTEHAWRFSPGAMHDIVIHMI